MKESLSKEKIARRDTSFSTLSPIGSPTKATANRRSVRSHGDRCERPARIRAAVGLKSLNGALLSVLCISKVWVAARLQAQVQTNHHVDDSPRCIRGQIAPFGSRIFCRRSTSASLFYTRRKKSTTAQLYTATAQFAHPRSGEYGVPEGGSRTYSLIHWLNQTKKRASTASALGVECPLLFHSERSQAAAVKIQPQEVILWWVLHKLSARFSPLTLWNVTRGIKLTLGITAENRTFVLFSVIFLIPSDSPKGSGNAGRRPCALTAGENASFLCLFLSHPRLTWEFNTYK